MSPARAATVTNLQVLRAGAAVLVVLYHAVLAGAERGAAPPLLTAPGLWGALGVDVFFVLSGFIMVYIQDRNPRKPLAFLANRVVRIVPTYWLLTSVMLALVLGWPDLFGRMTFDPWRAVTSYLFVTGPLFHGAPYLDIGWTLEYEILFYSLFALSLLLPGPRCQRAGLAAAILGAVLVFGLPLIVVEFLMGVGAGLMYLYRRPDPLWGWVLLVAGLAGLAATLVLPPTDDLAARALYWGGPAGLLVLGAALIPQTTARLPVFLGDASYSLYLIQAFTIPAFYKGADRLGLLGLPADAVALVAVAATVGAAALFYRLVEAPVQRVWRRRLSASPSRAAGPPPPRA